MTISNNFCVCSFTSMSPLHKATLVNTLGKNNNLEYCVLNREVTHPEEYLENILPEIDSVRCNNTEYTYKHIDLESITFLYKLFLLGELKKSIEVAHDSFYDCVVFVCDESKITDIQIPDFLATSTIYSSINYTDSNCNVDYSCFFCDTITFNIICDFFKFLKKTDIRFFNNYEATLTRFFNSCINMNNIKILNGCSK